MLLSATASAQGTPAYTELSPPQPLVADDAKKIEVVEFFWYGCPHCYNLEPFLETWQKKLPADVQFRRVPAVLSDEWEHDAAVFYTLDAMNLLGKLHRPLFDAIHRDRLRTSSQQAMAEWLKKQGVDPNRFFDTMKSMGVDAKVRRAAQMSIAYRINGTPAMAVQGRYTVSAEQGRSQQGLLDTVDYLVGIARKQK
jgi:thiol:disulfide interchange protein DsbA